MADDIAFEFETVPESIPELTKTSISGLSQDFEELSLVNSQQVATPKPKQVRVPKPAGDKKPELPAYTSDLCHFIIPGARTRRIFNYRLAEQTRRTHEEIMKKLNIEQLNIVERAYQKYGNLYQKTPEGKKEYEAIKQANEKFMDIRSGVINSYLDSADGAAYRKVLDGFKLKFTLDDHIVLIISGLAEFVLNKILLKASIKAIEVFSTDAARKSATISLDTLEKLVHDENLKFILSDTVMTCLESELISTKEDLKERERQEKERKEIKIEESDELDLNLEQEEDVSLATKPQLSRYIDMACTAIRKRYEEVEAQRASKSSGTIINSAQMKGTRQLEFSSHAKDVLEDTITSWLRMLMHQIEAYINDGKATHKLTLDILINCLKASIVPSYIYGCSDLEDSIKLAEAQQAIADLLENLNKEAYKYEEHVRHINVLTAIRKSKRTVEAEEEHIKQRTEIDRVRSNTKFMDSVSTNPAHNGLTYRAITEALYNKHLDRWHQASFLPLVQKEHPDQFEEIKKMTVAQLQDSGNRIFTNYRAQYERTIIAQSKILEDFRAYEADLAKKRKDEEDRKAVLEQKAKSEQDAIKQKKMDEAKAKFNGLLTEYRAFKFDIKEPPKVADA